MAEQRRNIRQGVGDPTPTVGNSFRSNPRESAPVGMPGSSLSDAETSPFASSRSESTEIELRSAHETSPLLILKSALLSGEHPLPIENPMAKLWTDLIPIRTLELLEAELLNQGYFSRSAELPTLTQIATYETNVHRWRARRSGLNSESVEFAVSVPRYVHYLGVEISQLSHEEEQTVSHRFAARKLHWKALFPNGAALPLVVQHLERWAAALLERRGECSSRYDRGHGLLIHNLIQAAETGPHNLALPVDPRTYLSRIRALSVDPPN